MSRRLAEVAKQVGVSEATVSRVLNDKPGVSEATRQAVLTALDVLGYERPTKLRGERARLVGLVLPELQNPIFPAFAEVVSGALAQQGFTPVLCTQTAGGVTEADYIDLLLSHQVSGVVFAGGFYAQADAPHEHYQLLSDRHLPTVLVNAAIDGLPFPRVSCDDAVAAEQALNHLRSLGHERIGVLLGPSDHVPSRRKLTRHPGARRNARGSRCPMTASRTACTRWRPPRRAPRPADRAGRDGHHLRVATRWRWARSARPGARARPSPTTSRSSGYDDSALMNCTEPPLTTVRQPIEPMGRMVIELLTRQMAGATRRGSTSSLFEPELVVRGSTGPAPDAAERPAAAPAGRGNGLTVGTSTIFCRVLAIIG